MKPKDQDRAAKADNQVIKNPEDKNYLKKAPNYNNPAHTRENSERPFDKELHKNKQN